METNFEHYKDEIAKIVEETKNLFLRLDRLEERTNFTRNEDASLANMLIEWGIKEYVEPYKLTSKEKWILENLNNKIDGIYKNGQTEDVWLKIGSNCYYPINYLFSNIKFECIECDKEYKIADILANCEVIE